MTDERLTTPLSDVATKAATVAYAFGAVDAGAPLDYLRARLEHLATSTESALAVLDQIEDHPTATVTELRPSEAIAGYITEQFDEPLAGKLVEILDAKDQP